MPEFRGVLETDDGATILFEWQGLAVLTDSGVRRPLGSLRDGVGRGGTNEECFRVILSTLDDPFSGRSRPRSVASRTSYRPAPQ